MATTQTIAPARRPPPGGAEVDLADTRDIPVAPEEKLLSSFIYYTLGVVLTIFLWGLGSLLLPESFRGFAPLPAFEALLTIAPTEHFQVSVVESMKRLTGGLAIAAVLGIPMGIAVGYFRRLNEITYTTFQFLRMTSPLSWMPIAIIIFGVGAGPVYFLIAIAAIWPMIINTAHGVHQVDRAWIMVARTLGANELGVIQRVIIPAVLPDILSGLRVALGVAWIVIVPAEMLGVASGLGYLILDYRDIVDYASIMAVILVVGFLGYTTDQVLRTLIKKVSWTA